MRTNSISAPAGLRRAFVLVAVAACASERPAPEVHLLQGEAFGTTWTVKWSGAVGPEAVEPDIVAVLAEVDVQMSTWRDDSELSRARAADGAVVVSEGTVDVVRTALALAEATGGAFDPTVEPLVEFWGFRGERRTTLPTEEALAEVRGLVGWERVTLGRSGAGEPLLDTGGTALDLSAIAKGHAVDRVSHALSAHGVANHYVEVGGEVRVSGASPRGTLWRLGVERPVPGSAPGADLVSLLSVTNRAVATSGNYRNAYVVDGVRVVHTLDPRIGRPVETPVASVTVIAPDCVLADGWATALMVLGASGLERVERTPDVEALLLSQGPDGALTAEQTTGMPAFLSDGM